jgi:hypothetical protein
MGTGRAGRSTKAGRPGGGAAGWGRAGVRPFRGNGAPASGRSVRVGILDLVAKKPTRSPYKRLVNPNSVSIMPQVIGVWAEELGHEVHYVTYTGFEDLSRALPRDIDILFICAFTPAAYLAYGISNLFRKQGVVTVLGGPHARAYAADARRYFDYVARFTDRALIRDLLRDFSPQPNGGVRISAPRQPRSLPGVRERWKFILQALDKTRFLQVVPMIGSLGCPYTCSFCIDSDIDYQPLPYDQIREDLIFLKAQLARPVVGWHDPNFGVRFNDYMGIIEEAVEPGTIRFVAESSLSLLSEPHLMELKRHGFGGLTIGIETWFDFNNKAKQGGRIGTDKAASVAAQVDLVTRYIPYVQANFVWGLDQDTGPMPFELTKRFVDLAPAAFPSHSLFTAYGDSAPLGQRLKRDGRVLDVPFHFLDTSSIHNVRLENYSAIEFYRLMADLVWHSYSPGATSRRFQRSKHPLSSASRWMTLVRSISESWRVPYFARLARRLTADHEFRAFVSGEGTAAPAFFRDAVKEDLGSFYDHLPEGVLPENASLRTLLEF